uniref:ATP synthase subunit a n=1 Tax=Whitmania laevis TaxID=307844 RepID=A0A0F6PBM4_WHILA|nr:ATP synthase F0 subunit 6 [Whitmania laevis]
MCLDVFSIFDVYEFNSMMYDKRMVTVFMVLVPLILCAFLMITLWSFNFSFISGMKKIIKIMSDQCNRSTSYMLKGYSIIIISLFLVLISVNLFGLVSFSFSTSSHLLFTLMVGLPLWVSMILSGFMFSSKAFIAHLLPDGAPLWLNPFLVLIESVSIMVRPITLSFRLAANMTAGHVVLCLMTSYLCIFLNCFNVQHLVLLVTSMMYLLFEVGICMIQGYIFCLLLSLYTDDHS